MPVTDNIKQMKDIMKIVPSLKDFCILTKDITQIIESETKEQREWIS